MKSKSTSAEPSSASDASNGLNAWDFDDKKLRALGDFVERMRKGGAVGCRVGPVAVTWAAPPLEPATDAKSRKKKPTEEEVLFHSAGG